jgi:hypothetical protein
VSDDPYDDLALPVLDERDYEHLKPALIRRLESQLAATAEARVKVARAVHQEVTGAIAKGGALVAYRERVRAQALNAFFKIATVDVSDLRKMIGLQLAIARYIDVEQFVAEQVGLYEGDNEPEGPSSGDDDPYADGGLTNGGSAQPSTEGRSEGRGRRRRSRADES